MQLSVSSMVSLVVNCIAFADSRIYSDSVREGGCIFTPMTDNLNYTWLTEARNYYQSMSSRYTYRRYAEYILGRPLNNETELATMCPRVEAKPEGLSTFARTLMFHKYVDQSCEVEPVTEEDGSPIQVRCTIIEDSDGKQPEFLLDYTETIPLTDNKSFVLLIRCINGIKDYKVITVERTPSIAVYLKVREMLTKLGFNPEFLHYLPCPEKL